MSDIVARHGRSLMRVAQHWSLCPDDAHDAYQRALEIYVRRLESLDPATEAAWLKVVVKHEALAVRRQRSEAVPVEDVDVEAADAQRPVDDLLAGREQVTRSAEALRRLKPDEAKALMLKAQGLSYREIGESLGWTYTKVNRCITEGRARFLKVYAEIEAGAECERFAPTLAALVAGTASADALVDLRPHIRNCAACRATVRDLHATRLGRLAALSPIPALVAPLRWASGRSGGVHIVAVPDPPASPPDLSPLQGIPDLDAVIGRVDAETISHPNRLLDLQAQLYQWVQRLHGTDVTAGVQLAAGSSGGGRIATIGAVIGLCLSSVGAGTVCVVSGIIPNPLAGEPHPHHVAPRHPRPATSARQRLRPAATPTPMATIAKPAPKRRAAPRRRASTRKPSKPTTHERAPASPAPTGATRDFALEQSAPSVQAAAAPAPSNGGGEFAP